MKKPLIFDITAMALTCFPLHASAAESAEVYVTIADNTGALALAAQPVTVTDTDKDGALTIHDALTIAHDTHYSGGTAGYSTSRTEFGLGITKLWGVEQGSSYGYCVNHQSALSLEDPVQTGDVLSAYAFTDLNTFSDTYCFFDADSLSVNAGDAITLTLTANGYDENWNPVQNPVEAAEITVNGEKSGYLTDAQGNVTLTLPEDGAFVLSAVSDAQVLVPPVCSVQVGSDAAPSEDSSAASPWTAFKIGAICLGVVLAAILGIVLVRKRHAK